MHGCIKCLAPLILLTGSALAQTAPSTTASANVEPADLSPLLQKILSTHKAPGIIAAILDGDRITALGAAGLRKVGSPEPITTHDLIHLGSDTKAMTAILIGQLIDQKQLTLDTPMRQIFLDLAPQMNPLMADVTVQQLLCHTAGLPANADWRGFERTKLPLTLQRAAMVKQVLSAPPVTPPGQTYAYSNTGYVLLGAILDKKTNQPWETLIQKNLFDPLPMTTAAFGPPNTPNQIDQPWGHILVPNLLKLQPELEPRQTDNAPIMNPAGRVHCSITDWAKFISLFLHPETNTLISAPTLAALLTPQPDKNYAAGWIIVQRPWAGGTCFTHSGSNTTWYCTAWVAPKKNFATLVAINFAGEDANKTCDETSAAIIKFHRENAPEKPNP